MKKIILFLIIAHILFVSFSVFSMESEELKEEFFKAAREGDTEKIKDFIIHNKVHIDRKNSEGNTALIIAVKNKQIPVVKELLIRGNANINIQDKNGKTALILAIEEKDFEMVKTLLNNAAPIKIDNKDHAGKTPLIWAVETNNIDIIKAILDEVPNPAPTYSGHDAMKIAQTDEVRKLLVMAQNQYNLYKKIQEKESNSDISDIEIFIATIPIISLNVKNIERNPLCLAIDIDNLSLVNLLIAHNADVNQIFVPRNTPLLMAIRKNKPNIEIVTSLLKKGANANAEIVTEDSFWTPLFLAINKPELIKLLVAYGAKVNYKASRRGLALTPLMYAIKEGNFDAIKELLEVGADPLSENATGKTAFDVANEELDKIINKLEDTTLSLKRRQSYEKEKKNYEDIIALVKVKAEETLLLSSLQKLTQSLMILQNMLL